MNPCQSAPVIYRSAPVVSYSAPTVASVACAPVPAPTVAPSSPVVVQVRECDCGCKEAVSVRPRANERTERNDKREPERIERKTELETWRESVAPYPGINVIPGKGIENNDVTAMFAVLISVLMIGKWVSDNRK